MARKKKIVIDSREDILSKYMEYRVADTSELASIEEFCFKCSIDPEVFYSYFDTILQLEQEIWESLLQHSIDTIQKDPLYSEFSAEEKILSLYFTFFENITLNKEYVHGNLETNSSLIGRNKVFKSLKPAYQVYIRSVFIQSPDHQPLLNFGPLKKVQDKSRDEGFWGMFLFLIDFWQKDDSFDYEKTDAAIEKSVRLATSLVDTRPVKNAIDFGKFLWKERGNYSFKKFK